ncbi:FOG: EAL domain [Sulfuriferula multivorans]|uniref:FOG: EAL domain n=1 Tax=Sulfuriferula multivorans TaxID=1559896 RepID=A0A401JZ39_9PROT|nr:FOG: EAL domain [Sulfuriferula multivorans]
MFHSIQTESEAILLDRLCRNLHLRNFLSMADETSWIFINVSPQVIVNGKHYGAYFSDLLQRYGIPPHRIVVEILEGGIHDEALLAEAVGYYRELGCLVAIDDFGAGHSNFERIWRIAPDIVKLDRSVIAQAAQNRSVARVLPNLVNLIHESGSLALIEGVETENEALIAMDSGIDFVQGFYFGRPSEELIQPGAEDNRIAELCGKFKTYSDDLEARQRKELTQYVEAFKRSASRIQAGACIEQACAEFLGQERAERCFMLNAEGMQLGKSHVSRYRENKMDPRFLPVSNAEGANWSRRHYFRRAVNNPGEVQTTRPYLSVAEANMCITLSIAIQADEDTRVFCCDLDWRGT